ncbi:MAG: TROVE domain-containing protein, partial [Thermodesulfobacteriota bacterium]
MARINTKDASGYRGFLKTENSPSIITHEGAPGYRKDNKTELFMLAITSFYGEDTFYEEGIKRNERFVELVHKVAVEDPEWIAGFFPWLRKNANIRTISVVGVLEATHTFVENDIPGGRKLISDTLSRADEPGEALAYWHQKYGRNLPKPVKRGIADAAVRLYTEESFIKYGNRSGDSYGFADVINLTHPTPAHSQQSSLFNHILNVRYKPEDSISVQLPILRNNRHLLGIRVEERKDLLVNSPSTLESSGITWEQVAGWLQGPMDASAWEAVIPYMKYMALLRNLRNFEEAVIDDHSV